jgi:DtxR family transcriptional regulator, Mn-dependent transcriptional regulator
MQSSLREDYLEAIQVLREKNGFPPHDRDLAAALAKKIPAVTADLDDLLSHGDIVVAPDGSVSLTEKGKSVSDGVIKKHETLQCFLSDILGMDTSSASNEACTLEHTISDETIDRLGDYLKNPPGGLKAGRNADISFADVCTPFSLLDFDEGDMLIVRCILGQSCAKRLLDLGVVPGERVKIRRKLANRSIVLQVKGCDVALSPEIAAAVSVERC